MKTKNILFFGAILASAVVLGLGSAAFAQSDSQNATPTKKVKPGPKPRKVWTDDDFGSTRTPAATRENQAASSGASQEPAAANQSTDSKPHAGGVPPVFTNPKSLEDADKMIAWENRDIEAQQESLEKLKTQIAEAPADQKERLTKVFEQRTQILAATRNELKNLQTKRKDLEKPPAGNQTASAEPPSN